MAQKTFLQLCQRTYSEVTGRGDIRPTSVVGQVGDLALVVNWVREEYELLQGRPTPWRWLRAQVTIPVTAGVRDYSVATIFPSTPRRFRAWRKGARVFKFYETSAGQAGERWLKFVPPEQYRQTDIGVPQTGRPASIAEMDDRSLRFLQVPEEDGTLTATYYKSAQILADNTDVPELPDEFHDLLWMRAAQRYALKEAAAEVYNDLRGRIARMEAELLVAQSDPFERLATTLVE